MASAFLVYLLPKADRKSGNFTPKVITVHFWHRLAGQIKRAIEFTLGEQTKVYQTVLVRMKNYGEKSVGVKETEGEDPKKGDPSMI